MRVHDLFPLPLFEEGRVVPGVNTTADVGANEIQKQAAKWRFNVSKDGVPVSTYTQTHARDQIIKEGKDPFRRQLERFFNSPKAIPDRYNREEQCWVFPDGSASGVCTNWMRYVRRLLGSHRVEFMGFVGNGSEISRQAGGHDFAVVDGRYIVDGWARHVARLANNAVFDLQDPAEREQIVRLFGEPSTWVKDEFGIADDLDAEKKKERAAAMAGVRQFDATPAARAGGTPGNARTRADTRKSPPQSVGSKTAKSP